MYLRDLAILVDQPDGSPDRVLSFFGLTQHVVVELVLAWIPRNKVVLDHLAKLNVVVGKRNRSEPEYDKWQGVGTYRVDAVNFEKYIRIPKAEQQRAVLTLLGSAFTYVAKASGNDASLCMQAIERVEGFGLPLPEIGSEAFWLLMPKHKKRSKRFREDIEFSRKLIARKLAAYIQDGA
jgi:hypothetical protein